MSTEFQEYSNRLLQHPEHDTVITQNGPFRETVIHYTYSGEFIVGCIRHTSGTFETLISRIQQPRTLTP